MTRAEALAEAQRRWGTNAYVQRGPISDTYRVGTEHFDPFYPGNPADHFEVKGSGDSWEAAFADADRRAE